MRSRGVLASGRICVISWGWGVALALNPTPISQLRDLEQVMHPRPRPLLIVTVRSHSSWGGPAELASTELQTVKIRVKIAFQLFVFNLPVCLVFNRCRCGHDHLPADVLIPRKGN